MATMSPTRTAVERVRETDRMPTGLAALVWVTAGLAFGAAIRTGNTIGHRTTFADLGATVAEWFGLSFRGAGTSFLAQVLR